MDLIKISCLPSIVVNSHSHFFFDFLGFGNGAAVILMSSASQFTIAIYGIFTKHFTGGNIASIRDLLKYKINRFLFGGHLCCNRRTNFNKKSIQIAHIAYCLPPGFRLWFFIWGCAGSNCFIIRCLHIIGNKGNFSASGFG